MRHNRLIIIKQTSPKQQKLIDASVVFLTTHPNASLGEMAENIGVGRATLQRHFPKRIDLAWAIAQDAIHKIDEA